MNEEASTEAPAEAPAVEAPPAAPEATPESTDPFTRALAALEAGSAADPEPEAEPEPEPIPEEPTTPDAEAPSVDEKKKEDDTEPTETPPAEAAPTESPRELAHFAKQRADFHEQQQQFQARQAELDQKLAAYQKLDTDPLGGLKDLGVSYKDLTERILKGEKAPDEAKPNKELTALREEIGVLRQEQQQIQHNAALSEYTATVKELVDENAEDRWGLLKAETDNYAGEIVDLIRQEHARSGVVLQPESAADRLEAYLVQRLETYKPTPKFLAILEKIRTKSSTTDPETATPSNGDAGSNGASGKTITNSDSAEVSRRAQAGRDEDECRSRALAVLKQASQ
jgi:hypothetical protein